MSKPAQTKSDVEFLSLLAAREKAVLERYEQEKAVGVKETIADHHRAHLKLLNQHISTLTDSNREVVVDLAEEDFVEYEKGLSEEHLKALTKLEDSKSKEIVASIMGVEAQHAVVLQNLNSTK